MTSQCARLTFVFGIGDLKRQLSTRVVICATAPSDFVHTILILHIPDVLHCQQFTPQQLCSVPQYVSFWSPVLLIFGRPFVKRFALCYQTVVCLSVLSVCGVGVVWPNGWMDQDETWLRGRPRSWPHYVRWRSSSPFPNGAELPSIFGPYHVAKWLDGSRCHLVGR